MGKLIDVTGQRFGKLTAIKSVKREGKVTWECECDCGNVCYFGAGLLRSGNNKSCGCMSRVYLEGKKFNRLTVIRELDSRIHGGIAWECVCECGEIVIANTKSLKSGNTKSCGCLQKEKASVNIHKNRLKREDLTGKTFGRWTVLNIYETEVGRPTRWLCECECGTISNVQTITLKSGTSRSCGCLHSDLMKGNVGELNPNYKPHLTAEDRLRYRYMLNGKSISKWREKVYHRDNWTCQNCFKRGGDIEAHHLNSWNAFPDERFNIENGITLCVECHKLFHTEYGYGDNTYKQFEDFKNKQTATV